VSVDIKSLAASLGVSASTVSRALNGYTDVSEQTRARVMQRAKELNYQPDPGARRLVKGRADAVGVVYPVDSDSLGNCDFLQMISGFSKALEEAGFDLLLAAARETNELSTYQRLVHGKRVDGILVANTLVDDPRIDYLQSAGIPFVCYGRSSNRTDFSWLDFDNEAGEKLAVKKLAALGHQRIAYVHAPLSLNFAYQRHQGFLAGMQNAGLAVDPTLCILGSWDRRSGYAAVQTLLRLPHKPTAIIVDTNVGGIGVIRGLMNEGVALGKDISVIVDGGIPNDSLLHDAASFAAIVQPTPEQSGQTMAQMLLECINSKSTVPPRHVLVQPAFVEGQSLGQAPQQQRSSSIH
jgi:LacI family transcriptional regulator